MNFKNLFNQILNEDYVGEYRIIVTYQDPNIDPQIIPAQRLEPDEKTGFGVVRVRGLYTFTDVLNGINEIINDFGGIHGTEFDSTTPPKDITVIHNLTNKVLAVMSFGTGPAKASTSNFEN